MSAIARMSFLCVALAFSAAGAPAQTGGITDGITDGANDGAAVGTVAPDDSLRGGALRIPEGAMDPLTSGAVDSTAWIADSVSWAADSVLTPGSIGIDPPATNAPPTPTPVPTPSPATVRSVPLRATPGALPKTATGVYGGYPTWAGAMIVAPADGVAAFRTGITGLPEIGILWTPGFEFRFGQEPGTYAVDSAYAFGNLYLGRSYREQEDRDYTGLECGLGYRWIIDDRRGYRWIAALEGGGYWRSSSAWPLRPCLRFSWLLVE